tara:strand:+ start:12393 stop:12692 length:300 start_codon:yes stop_codon:yes gene_type:complete
MSKQTPARQIIHGQKTISAAGTAERLVSDVAPDKNCYIEITIKALTGNTNNVYVGDSDVSSSNGYVLDAAEQVTLKVKDLSTIYLDVDTNDEGVSFIGS